MNAVKVRLSGDLDGITNALRVLHIAALAEGFEITEKSGLYPTRREPGYRMCVTLRFPTDDNTTDSRGATHRRQAIRRPAAPSRRHLP